MEYHTSPYLHRQQAVEHEAFKEERFRSFITKSLVWAGTGGTGKLDETAAHLYQEILGFPGRSLP